MCGEIGIEFGFIEAKCGFFPLHGGTLHLFDFLFRTGSCLGSDLDGGRRGLVEKQNQGDESGKVGGPTEAAKGPKPGTHGLGSSRVAGRAGSGHRQHLESTGL
jgi:hypothetical protein